MKFVVEDNRLYGVNGAGQKSEVTRIEMIDGGGPTVYAPCVRGQEVKLEYLAPVRRSGCVEWVKSKQPLFDDCMRGTVGHNGEVEFLLMEGSQYIFVLADGTACTFCV